ncbi:methyltransferase [Bosea sp. BK604]|uniref:class I SAM-dependent methyltransferase n=1 Tax=Bosea sp. BK604 TaxID=2512180 RepID=UPI0010515A19|nr:methyltransferase [Bosea sp. BK604]TCR67015.1 putative nicotinamide N-methyase [Bosea sp. BK604]
MSGEAVLDRRGFILAHTRLLPAPHAPEISLHVAEEATELWQKTEDELATIGLPPPFWAFAWAGGQALARYILDHPEFVRGRRVLDFASGSGLVAIAAAKAGAAQVEACDIDAFAAEAMQLNAAVNDVSITARLDDLIGRDEGWEVICAGDVCYERAMAESVVAWLSGLVARGAQVLIGDPGRSYLPKDRLVEVATYQVPVTRSLEDAEIKKSTVWALSADGG